MLGSNQLRARIQAVLRMAHMECWPIMGLSAGAIVASTVACAAGPCAPEISAMQARLNARLAEAAAAAPPAPESTQALRHHQPTPRSVASALVSLGVFSPERAKIIREAMSRARRAERAGNTAACERALDDVKRTIGF